MKITNDYNLPQAFYNAISEGVRKPEPLKIHCTELIGPPLIRFLRIKYWDDLVEDASERLWSLFGQAPHYILSKYAPQESLSEEKLKIKIMGWEIVGTPDLYYEERIEDYKFTSTYSFLLGEKKEWIDQLNVYAHMLVEHGFNVRGARINAILRDWQKSKAKQDPDYPQIPFFMQEITLKPYSEIRIDIVDWIEQHQAEVPRICTDSERWMRPTTWAVIKQGNKRATRVLETQEEAEKYIIDNTPKGKWDGKWNIVERKGAYIRCQDYCPVRKVCPYGIQSQVEEENHV